MSVSLRALDVIERFGGEILSRVRAALCADSRLFETARRLVEACGRRCVKIEMPGRAKADMRESESEAKKTKGNSRMSCSVSSEPLMR